MRPGRLSYHLMSQNNQDPEQIARDNIDRMLVEPGWVVQNKNALDLSVGPGVVRKY